MNLLKSWRESFSYFRPSFFKESFSLFKSFLPFFLKYFSWIFVLPILNIKNSLPIRAEIINLIGFSLVAYVWSKYLSAGKKPKILSYLFVFIIWAGSLFIFDMGINYFISYIAKVHYSEFLQKILYFKPSGWTWFSISGVVSIWSQEMLFYKNILLYLPVSVFFAFEFLRRKLLIKNIFAPFLSYPFFIICLAIFNFFIIFVNQFIFFPLAWIFAHFFAANSFGGFFSAIFIFFSLFWFPIFLYLFFIAVIANVYIKQCKKDESFSNSWFFRFFGK